MLTPPDVSDLSVEDCADGLAASVGAVRRAEVERLVLAAHWADLHPPGEHQLQCGALVEPADGDRSWSRRADDRALRGVGRGADAGERSVRLGAEGIPAIREFAAVELGMLLETTTYVATGLIRDALELRHRLPQTWQITVTGQVDLWKARRVASATRPLSVEQARRVDARVAPALAGLPTKRALDVLEAAVVAADPAAHEARRRAAEEQRYVALGRRPNASGLRSLICQTTAGDVARLDAMIAHLAELLARSGDTDAMQVRRAKALAILADPARACQVLAEGRAREDAHAEHGARAAARDDGADGLWPPPDGPDEQATAVGRAVSVGEFLRCLDGRARERLRPRTVLYVHLAEEALDSLTVTPGCGRPDAEVARVRGLGPVGLQQLRDWLGHDRIDVRPVIDPAGQVPVDEYAVPPSMAEAMEVREPFEVFPWGTAEAGSVDLDHTVAFRSMADGGERGQTRPDNLGPLGRHHHRAKTFGGFRCHQPLPGVYLWQTPSGHWFQVDHTGSTALGRERPAILGTWPAWDSPPGDPPPDPPNAPGDLEAPDVPDDDASWRPAWLDVMLADA